MPRIPVGIRIEEELVERLRDAVWHVGQGLTITSVVEASMRASAEYLEKKHNGGQRFPKRGGRLARSPQS